MAKYGLRCSTQKSRNAMSCLRTAILDWRERIEQQFRMYRIIGGDGMEYGPVSAEQLRQWIQEGRVTPETRVSREGTVEWLPLTAFPEFNVGLPLAALPRATQRRTHPLATTSMILGIVALTIGWCCCYGLPFNILGLIFALVALNQIRSQPHLWEGQGLAITGLVLSSVSLVISVVMTLVFGIATTLSEITNKHQL